MGTQMGSKIAQTSDLGPPSRPRDAKGRPEASREQFLGLQGPILVPLWNHFGAVWWLCSDHVSTPPSSLFRGSRYLLALPLLLVWGPSFLGSAGARASAYNYNAHGNDGGAAVDDDVDAATNSCQLCWRGSWISCSALFLDNDASFLSAEEEVCEVVRN